MKLKSRKIISMALVFFMMLTILPLAPATAHAAGSGWNTSLNFLEGTNEWNVQLSDTGVLTWDAQGTTGKYTVQIFTTRTGGLLFDVPGGVSEPSIDLKKEFETRKIENGYYYMYIATKNDSMPVGTGAIGVAYVSAQPKLAEPQNLRWFGQTAMWDNVEGATKYEVRVYKADGTLTLNSTATPSDPKVFCGSNYTGDGYWFEVVATADGYRNSNAAESPKLEANLQFNNQSPAMPDGASMQFINATEGDSITFTFDNEDVISTYTVEKYLSLTGPGIASAETETKGDSGALEFTRTFNQPGMYTLKEVLRLKNGSDTVKTKTNTFYIFVKEQIVPPTLSGTAFYTSGTAVGKPVTIGLGGDVASISDDALNYQWQTSNDGTSGWSNIDDATEKSYPIPAQESYFGKYIRVVVTADGYLGEVVSPAQVITKQSNMTEVPETPSLTKNTEGTAITITNYQADQEYVVSTNGTPDWTNNTTKSNGNKFEGLTTNTTYYVHTRMAETAEKQAGFVVRSANIHLAETVYLTNIELVAEKYVAKSGDAVKITVNPVPGNATGFDGAKLYLNYGAGAKLYTDENCTTEITYNDTYYTTVYLKGNAAETVTVSAERSTGSAPYKDDVKIEIADSNDAFAFGASEIELTPNFITIPQGGTAIVELSSQVTPEKPIANAVWESEGVVDFGSGLTIKRIDDTNQFLVTAAETCAAGEGRYNVTVNDIKQTNTLNVTVTATAIPVENISIVPAAITLAPDGTYDLTAVITPANATNATVTWTSDKESVATVANGKVTAVAEGTATITATVDGKSATCSVVVVNGYHTDHDFDIVSNSATCTEPGTITLECGCTVESPAKGHDWEAWDSVLVPTCQQGDYTQYRDCKNNCGEQDSRIIKAMHMSADEWSSNADGHWKVCRYGCGTVLVDKEAHSYGGDRVCDICNYKKPSSGGSYGGGSYVAPDKDADSKLRIVMQINNKNILVNGKTMVNDVAPVIVGDRTLVPIRVVTELLGGSADWDNATRTVTLKIDGKVLSMTIGKPIPGFGTSAVIMNDRTYVPVRYVMEKLGAEVEWINATQQIIIEK